MTLHDKPLAPENKDLLQWIPPVVALSLALAVIALMGGQSVTFGDAGDYLEAARALLKGSIHEYPGFPSFARLCTQ